jgi:hypothetical protein
MDSLARCIFALRTEEIKAERTGLGAFCPDAVAESLLGVHWYKTLQFSLGSFMLKMSRTGPQEDSGKLRPGVRAGHINNPNSLDTRLRGLNAEKGRGLAALDTPPKLPLGSDNKMLVEGIGVGLDLDPFAAAGNDREHRPPSSYDPHIVLQLGRILFCSRLFGERPRKHEFSFEDRAACLDASIKSSAHPAHAGMPNMLLHIGNDLAGIGLVPAAVELFRNSAQLDDEVARRVYQLSLAAFFAP